MYNSRNNEFIPFGFITLYVYSSTMFSKKVFIFILYVYLQFGVAQTTLCINTMLYRYAIDVVQSSRY